MKTSVYLYRHGRPAPEKRGRFFGHTDIALSRGGEGQMEKAAADLIGRLVPQKGGDGEGAVTAFYSSDLSRARRSAEILAAPLGLVPVPSQELRECRFGAWEGLSFEEVCARDEEGVAKWFDDPSSFRPPGGEGIADVRERVMPLFHALRESHAGGRVVIVAHGGVNRIIIASLLQLPVKMLFSIDQDYAALNIIEFRGEKPVLKLLNHTCL